MRQNANFLQHGIDRFTSANVYYFISSSVSRTKMIVKHGHYNRGKNDVIEIVVRLRYRSKKVLISDQSMRKTNLKIQFHINIFSYLLAVPRKNSYRTMLQLRQGLDLVEKRNSAAQ